MLVKKVSKELVHRQDRINWLIYWKHFSHKKQNYCSEVNCLNAQQEAVLARAMHGDDIFVVPLCEKHASNLEETIEIEEQIERIPYDMTL